MGDMSDLDLVAKAMEPTNVPDKPTSSQTRENGDGNSTLPVNDNDNEIDLSSLTPEDLALLQPLLNALNIEDPDSLDEGSLQDILKQMDAAGEVADDLEGKLDRLIGELGKVEEGILEGMEPKDKAEASAKAEAAEAEETKVEEKKD